MAREDEFDAHFGSALKDGVEIVHFEPEQEAVSVGFVQPVGDGAVIVFYFEAVELEDESAVRDEAFIGGATVVAPAAKEALIPATRGFDVSDRDEGLGPHFG